MIKLPAEHPTETTIDGREVTSWPPMRRQEVKAFSTPIGYGSDDLWPSQAQRLLLDVALAWLGAETHLWLVSIVFRTDGSTAYLDVAYTH